MGRNHSWLLFTLMVFLSSACDSSRVFEENQKIEGNIWPIDSVRTFKFSIQDTSGEYNLYYNIRNTLHYPFSNLYITFYLEDSTGGLIFKRLDEMYLMDAKTGRPFGSGMGDIFDHKFIFLKQFKFPYSGPYQMRFQQYMRTDSLPEVMSVGFRVERNE